MNFKERVRREEETSRGRKWRKKEGGIEGKEEAMIKKKGRKRRTNNKWRRKWRKKEGGIEGKKEEMNF